MITNQLSRGFINQPEKVVESEAAEVTETSETSEAPWWGWLLAVGLIGFEAGTFAWIRKCEKQGYKLSEMK